MSAEAKREAAAKRARKAAALGPDTFSPRREDSPRPGLPTPAQEERRRRKAEASMLRRETRAKRRGRITQTRNTNTPGVRAMRHKIAAGVKIGGIE